MALPRIDAPIFTIKIPSTGKDLKFRPFTVKEEKLLLMAQTSEDPEQINETVKQILNNCFLTEIDIDTLAIFDVEYIFIKLRSKSVDNKITVKFEDGDEVIETGCDLEDVNVVFDTDHTNKIKLSDEVLITMKYPSFKMIDKMSATEDADMVDVLSNTIDMVVVGEEVMKISDFSKEEVGNFIESFTGKNMRQIEQFFQTLPKLKIDLPYKNKEGETKMREVVGLQSFFT